MIVLIEVHGFNANSVFQRVRELLKGVRHIETVHYTLCGDTVFDSDGRDTNYVSIIGERLSHSLMFAIEQKLLKLGCLIRREYTDGLVEAPARPRLVRDPAKPAPADVGQSPVSAQ